MDATVFHHFPLPYPGLYQPAANRQGFSRFSPRVSRPSLRFMDALLEEIKAAETDAIKAHVGKV